MSSKTAGGDLKAIPLLLNETRSRESEAADAARRDVFDTPEDQKVLDGIIRRIRGSDDPTSLENAPSPPPAETNTEE
jgi:hypothetical protein